MTIVNYDTPPLIISKKHPCTFPLINKGSPDKSRVEAKTCPLTDTHRFPMIFLSHIKHKPR